MMQAANLRNRDDLALRRRLHFTWCRRVAIQRQVETAHANYKPRYLCLEPISRHGFCMPVKPTTTGAHHSSKADNPKARRAPSSSRRMSNRLSRLHALNTSKISGGMLQSLRLPQRLLTLPWNEINLPMPALEKNLTPEKLTRNLPWLASRTNSPSSCPISSIAGSSTICSSANRITRTLPTLLTSASRTCNRL